MTPEYYPEALALPQLALTQTAVAIQCDAPKPRVAYEALSDKAGAMRAMRCLDGEGTRRR